MRPWENTGFTALFPNHNSIGFAFYDVADPEGLIDALARAHGEETLDDTAGAPGDDAEDLQQAGRGDEKAGAHRLRDGYGDRFSSRLRAGERLLWTGAPDPARNLDARDAWLIPLGVVLGAVSVWSAVSFAADGSPMAALIDIPGLLLGLLLMGGRFFL